MMRSPYFQTDFYRNESHAGKIEQKIEQRINYIYNKLKDLKNKVFKNRRSSQTTPD
jgi:hypothetical protein